jgi:hypothetical protein
MLIHKFDGTTVAGGVHQLGAGDEQELIGSSEKLDAAKMLSIMKEQPLSNHGVDDNTDDDDNDNDGNGDDDGGEDTLYDVLNVHREVNRVARNLYRSCEAHHLTSAVAPICILVANFFHVSLSSIAPLVESLRVQARHLGSRFYFPATVEAVNEDG